MIAQKERTMFDIVMQNVQAMVLGIIGSLVIVTVLGYAMDWILTLLLVTNYRLREYVMVTGGFFGGMATIIFVTSVV